MMRRNASVCIEVDRMTNLANWESVIAWGHFEELKGAPAEAHPGNGHLHLYRIRLYDKSGRFERG